MGGKTAARVKNANTKKNYDRLAVFVPKGKKAFLVQEAKEAGFESLNSYINYCINQEITSRKGPQRLEEVRKAEFIKVLVPEITINRILCVCEQDLLCSEILSQFPDMEVECCSQQELYQFDRNSFDVVIFTKSVEYVTEPEITLTKIRELLRIGGMFVWVFDEEVDMVHSFHVVSGNSAGRVEYIPKDSLADSIKKLEEINEKQEYQILDADRHGYEPWNYILAWKSHPGEETGIGAAMENRDRRMSRYFESCFAASGGNPWK